MDNSTPVNQPNPKRTIVLEFEREKYQKKQAEVEQWLMRNFSHPDRMKYYDDRNFYMCKLNQINEKIENLKRGIPENGYSTVIEPHSFTTVNKRTNQ